MNTIPFWLEWPEYFVPASQLERIIPLFHFGLNFGSCQPVPAIPASFGEFWPVEPFRLVLKEALLLFFTILILSSFMTLIYVNKPTHGSHHHLAVVWTTLQLAPSWLLLCVSIFVLHLFLFFGCLCPFFLQFFLCALFLSFIVHFFVLWATNMWLTWELEK